MQPVEPSSEKYVWWGDVNHPISEEHYDRLRNRLLQYVSDKQLYVSVRSGNFGTLDCKKHVESLTKVDDTNVTLTLGGSPSTALLAASSLTLGWTGTLAASREEEQR